MSFFKKLFSNKIVDNTPAWQASDFSVSLQVLFSEKVLIRCDELLNKCREFHAGMSACQINSILEDQTTSKNDPYIFDIKWAEHAIKVVGLNDPMPNEALELSLNFAPYDDTFKEVVLSHKGHALLYYEGKNKNPLEQYIALTFICSILYEFGATIILNENVSAVHPLEIFQKTEEQDYHEFLATSPMVFLYCGMHIYRENNSDVWLRTTGAEKFNLPNFAIQTSDHQISEYYVKFSEFMSYAKETGATIHAGDTLQSESEEAIYKTRKPRRDEEFLIDGSTMLVLEMVREAPKH